MPLPGLTKSKKKHQTITLYQKIKKIIKNKKLNLNVDLEAKPFFFFFLYQQRLREVENSL
jgi:hypothetical protein